MITPTTKEIADTIVSQIAASLNQTIPSLPKSFYRVLARVTAGVFVLLYKYLGFMFLQIFVDTASIRDTEVNGQIIKPLVSWGRLIGIGDPVAATNAELLIDVTVETQVGVLDPGTQLLNVANGVTYIVIGTVTLDAPVVQATIRAVSDQADGGGAGAVGNLEPGDIVSFANPLANVARNAVVDSQLVTGADGESTAAYRQRIIDRFQKRPQGGAGVDYELWAEEVAGIINVYPYTGAVPGYVDVYSESSGDPDGIPTAAQLDAVEAAITFDSTGAQTRKPVNARLNSYPITRTGFDVSVGGLDAPDQATVETDIETAVSAYFLGRGPFIEGVTVRPRRDRIERNNVLSIVNDVVSAAGGTFQTVALNVTGSPLTTDFYALGVGEKAKLTSIVFA